jgi:hypothetical protein
MARVYGAYSTGGTNAFRVGYEIGEWSAVSSGSTSVTANFQLFVGNQFAVDNDTQTLNFSWAGVSSLGGITSPFSVEYVSDSDVNEVNGVPNANQRNVGPIRTVTFNYPEGSYGSSPGNFTGTITGLGSSTPLAKGFYTGGPATHTFSITIPARPGSVPSAPTSVTSTPGDNQVSISFGAPSSNDPAATSYQQSTDNANWSAISTNPFIVAGTNGTARTVYVRAINAVGEGASASATSTPYGQSLEPTSVSSTPANGSISVSYGAPTDSGGRDVDYYQYSTNSGSSWDTTPSNPFSVAGTNGTAITVYVAAVTLYGRGLPAQTTSTPRTVPSAPTTVSSTPANGSISVSFGAPSSNGGSAVTGYEYSTNSGSTYTAVPSNTSPFTVSGTNGTAITVLVRATNAAGAGATESTTNTPRTVPGAPASVTSTPSNGSVSIAFTVPSSDGGSAVTSYQYSTDNSTFVTAATNPFTVSGTNGTALTVYVRAVNAAGAGASASATSTPRTVPSAPQSFAGDNTTFGQITLSWSAPSSNGGNAVSSYVLRTGATVLQNTSATSYVHTGLSPYTDYSYTVTAANAAGEGTAASLTVKTMGGVAKVWNGTAWVTVLPKVYNGTVWVEAQARMWDGSEWKHGI